MENIAESVAPQAQPATEEGEQPAPLPVTEHTRYKRCAKCGKQKRYDTNHGKSEFPYWPARNTWATWCKVCYGEAAKRGRVAAKMRREGDQASAIMPGEGELQRSVRRGDKLMSVKEWAEQESGALLLLNGEAVYQLETGYDDIKYVRILRRYPLARLPRIPVESFVYLRGDEEGVYYQ